MSEMAVIRRLEVGGGARFWAYISPQNDTRARVTRWQVDLQQGNWKGSITSDDPEQILQTPKLAGSFNVTVHASGPDFPWQELKPQQGTQPGVIGCGVSCAAMVGIVADPDGKSAQYWTVWDAFCTGVSESAADAPRVAGTVQPCTAAGLDYRAFKRLYGGGPAYVLDLFASGYYGDAPHEMFFAAVNGEPNRYRLMEKVPGVVYFIVSYYAASFSSQVGLPGLGDQVTIVDASGEHVVKVEEY